MDRANAADPNVANVVWEGRDKVEFGMEQVDSIYGAGRSSRDYIFTGISGNSFNKPDSLAPVNTARTNPAFVARGDGSGLVVTAQGWNDYVRRQSLAALPDSISQPP